ncbi:unnamed protein product [Urochloa humidicola]
MFKYLPRHQFGSLQGKMFLTYFVLISASSAISVAAFAYLHPWKKASTIYQLGFLLSSLGHNLSNLLVFTPMTVEVKYFFFHAYDCLGEVLHSWSGDIPHSISSLQRSGP